MKKNEIKDFLKKESFAISGTLLLIFLFFIYILWETEGYIGGADSLTHYKFSRYSWDFPKFFLHHWAKPVFTLMSSPFAQFGYDGIVIFNLLGGLASGFFAYLSARKLGYNSRFLAPVMLLFMPIYTLNVLSGLTEVLFGLFIIASAYFCFARKYLLAAIIISFSHLVRTEGIIIIPIFGLFFLMKRQFRVIPWLLTGTFVYSIIGYFHFKDFFWLITQMPYTGAKKTYGTGDFSYFFDLAPTLLGKISLTLIIIGSLVILYEAIFKKNPLRQGTNNLANYPDDSKILSKSNSGSNIFSDELLLLFLPFIMYYFAHAVMWWSGIGNSLGMHRYVVAIVPVGSLIALKGFNLLKNNLDYRAKTPVPGYILILLVIVFLVRQPFQQYNFPQKMGGMEKVMHEGSQYIIENNLDRHKIFYYDPAFFYFVGFNPYDTLASKEFVHKPDKPHYLVNEGDIVIWDGHFSPLRALSLDSLRTNPCFEELAAFKPQRPFKIFETDYQVVIFQRNEKFCE